MSRVGILGGSFDPPHVAHTAMAAAARVHLDLSTVLLVPACSPPHKDADSLSPFAHRLAMTRIAAAGVDGVEVSPIERDRPGPSYTVETLRALERETGGDLYFIMGSDSLRELGTWYQPQALIAMCTLVVFPREGEPVGLDVPGAASVVVFEEPVIDVSSTEIRRRLRCGQTVEGMVAPGVLDYIRAHSLYTNP